MKQVLIIAVVAIIAAVNFILGDKFRCNYSTTIDCSDADIKIGNNVVLGWNVTIKNNDGHYVVENGKDSIISKKIIIKDHVYGDGHACERIANILEEKEYQEWIAENY